MDFHLLEKKHLLAIVSIMIITIVIITSIVSVFLNSHLLRINNNVTLVVEIGIGLIITTIVYGISRRSEIKIDKKITDVLDIVKTGEELQKMKKIQIQNSILIVFKEIKTEIENILQKIEVYYAENDPKKQKNHKKQIIDTYKAIKNLSEKNLDDLNIISLMFFDVNTIEFIKTISNTCKNKPDFSREKSNAQSSLYTLLQMVDEVIGKLRIETQSSEEMIQEHPKIEESLECDIISASTDRTVYPLDSTMHMRANLGSDFNKKEKILFEIFNSNQKLLLSQYVDIEKNGYLELAEAGIFQADFKMEGKAWRVGETYILKVTHGSSYAEDTFVIDKRTPVIQSDKSVYTINSDMILTVIDPDGDKDNEVSEYVGDREDSKVIIESKYGKIEGYKLKETGRSTGIFQGIIGFLGMMGNGTVIPRNLNGKIIDAIQGTELDDRFIVGDRGEEIKITYKNRTRTAYLSVFISNFGAMIELDQKIYAPTDKVCLTIVAPDLSFDSSLVNEIGQTDESMIQIHTSTDKLTNYKLLETGIDTGVFTGELQLTNDPRLLQNFKNNHGPNDGLIHCSGDDTIEVVLNLFGNEKIIGRALIEKI